MAEQSHREEMGAAIRAQRERNAVPRSISPEPPAAAPPPPPQAVPEPEPEPEKPRRLLDRFRGK
jgi:hypothetical protein